jgi:hypothetical protein
VMSFCLPRTLLFSNRPAIPGRDYVHGVAAISGTLVEGVGKIISTT